MLDSQQASMWAYFMYLILPGKEKPIPGIQKNKNMKKIFIPILLLVIIINSCSKDIVERNLEFPALQPASTDINAGTWKPILLTGPTEIPVAAPGADLRGPRQRRRGPACCRQALCQW